MFLSFLNKCLSTTIVVMIFSSTVFASTEVSQKAISKITEKLTAMQINVSSVSPFVVDGLYEVLTNQGVYYISENAQFLIHGTVYDLDNDMENVSEKSVVTLRIAKLKEFEKDMIVYKAPDEKHVVTIFTDTNCGYCQKLHAEMADYHKQGITIRYLAFPRGGIRSGTYHSMVSIWCSDEPKQAMDAAKSRHQIESKTCKNNVKEQYELGLFFGVKGTPAMVFEDGSLNPGYVPADRLIKILDETFN